MILRAVLAGLVLMILVAGVTRPVVPSREEAAPTEEVAPVSPIPPEWEARLAELEERNAELRARLDLLEQPAAPVDAAPEPLLERYPMPVEVTLCGERLPLERADVYQRFEEEWARFLVNQHWLLKWMRRSRDIFPFVESRLAASGMPDDLKYVLVVESGLEARAYSSAGAAGWWQFIKSTGKRYGLTRDSLVDERRDLGLATDAAIEYFRELHEEFGSWPLALSAYNAGEKRVRDEREAQGESDFYDLSLPRETEAYWFKAAALKVLLEDPARYGLTLPPDPWAYSVCDTIQLKVTRQRVALREIAEGAGITYRQFRELNPAYRRTWVSRGTHRFVLPHAGVDPLLDSLEGVKLARRQRGGSEPAPAVGSVPAEPAPADVGLSPRD